MKRKGVYQFLFIPYETEGCDLSVKPVGSFCTPSLDRHSERNGTNNVIKSTGSKNIVTGDHEETASNNQKFIDHHKITVDHREQMEDNFYDFKDYRSRAETFSMSSDNSTTSLEDLDDNLPNTDIPLMEPLGTTENMTFMSNEDNILDKIDKMMLHYLE